MKCVVITWSARGLGLELAKEFRKNDFNIVISDILKEELKKAVILLNEIDSKGKVISVYCDVTSEKDLNHLMDETIGEFGKVDIWINNAGVNQPMKPIWELETSVVDKLIDIDLKSTVIGSKIAMKQMIKQGFGQIYGVEGYGSNDAYMLGLSIYGTSKRAITYFFRALAKEVDEMKYNIQIGLLSPGIMITDFITHSMGNDKFELPEKTKKVYNILGDYPDVISNFLVNKMINNKKNNVRFNWLTNSKASFRFMTCAFNKRDFFK